MDNYDTLYGKTVYSSEGDKIGTLDSLYAADGDQKPTLATVATGWFGTKSSFFPLTKARLHDDDIVLPYTKDKVKDAPNIEQDAEVNDDESQALYEYYGLGSISDTDNKDETASDTASMTLSEEEVNVGKRTVETGRYRLKKFVVTEHVTQTVPVQREEVRLVREPIEDGDRGDTSISEDEQEVVTHGEVPVVEKNTVAKERVGLEATTINDEETVGADVRKERVEVDGDAGELRR